MIDNIYQYHEKELNYFHDLFTKAKLDNKFVKIYEFYISIEKIQFSGGECKNCNTSYTNIDIDGTIYIPYKYVNIKYNSSPYQCTIDSAYILCKCGEYNEEKPLLLFDCVIETNKKKCLINRFLNKDEIYTVEKIE